MGYLNRLNEEFFTGQKGNYSPAKRGNFSPAMTPFNRVDVERGVFQRENMNYLTGEYEAFLYYDEERGENILRISMECEKLDVCDRDTISENFSHTFFKYKPSLLRAYEEGSFDFVFNFTNPMGLEQSKIKGRQKRLVDKR